MPLNPLVAKDLKKLTVNGKNDGATYIKLQDAELEPYNGLDISRLDRLAKILRGLIFATVEGARSGHPGGSSSKVEQFLALTLGGSLAFDPADPKHPGRDRLIWSAGHCTPLLYGGQALYYEAMRRAGRQFSEAVVNCVLPEHLSQFRRLDGPPGHAESQYPYADYCTGPSGHGFSAAGGMAIAHASCGLPTKVWVMMGDAESEEGMTFEARNVLVATATDNIIVSLDYNHFGIDGPIEEAMSAPYLNYWLGFGWNVIEANGHNVNELLYAYAIARQGFDNSRPTAIIAHTIKGKEYGAKENTTASHGSPTDHEDYVKILKQLGFSAPGEKGNVARDIQKILDALTEDDASFIDWQLEKGADKIEPESELIARMKKTLPNRPLINPRGIKRPKNLPPELAFKPGDKISMRQASELWCKWLMEQTAFFYAGAGDLSKSVLLGQSEHVYGIINAQNKFGRGIRFGIAEQNMAMMSMALTQDVLPGGFRPVSVFGTYGVFTAMYGHAVHLALVANAANPATQGFFIALATHDGPETGEDGPTHQGMYWMSLFDAYPGIKVYKPTDANEVIEMLFFALEKGEPIVLALSRSETPVLDRKNTPASSACDGAYIYKEYTGAGKKIALAVCGATLLQNVLLALPDLAKQKLDVKIVVVTSPELFVELEKTDPKKAQAILSDEERATVIALHNGWNEFTREFIQPAGYQNRLIGVDHFLKSGRATEVYGQAGLDTESLVKKNVHICHSREGGNPEK
ncbi:MAG: 1-deoxy-D-xylulose-5-phosphate synthase N-terminal domain-containing protein [Patescibacteria group bacterium]|nr:1-deoxy-D-xylulose-5-phosphate synthase N-terminal domain-containing protein [Patescibacteria group bacterium]